MQRLICSRTFLLARRVSLRPVNFQQCRQLTVTPVLDRRVRKTKRSASEKEEMEAEPEDHLEAFEKYRKVQKEKKKIRSKEEKAKANVAKEEVEKKNKTLNMAVNILLGIILLIGLDSLYRYIDLSSQMRMQEEMENLDRIPLDRFFSHYLARGDVEDMAIRFDGTEQKEIVVTLQNGQKFLMNVNYNTFHTELGKFENDYNIHPSERVAGRNLRTLTQGSTFKSIENFGDYKANIQGQLLGSVFSMLITAYYLFMGGGTVKGLRQRLMQMGQMVMRQMESNNPNAKKSAMTPVMKTNVKLSDVAGMKGEKQEIEEFVQYLKNPDRFTSLGARMPKGVLLTGPPGTGKTMLAKAVANDCNVPFYYKSSSEFVQSLAGKGAKDIREMFAVARKNQPCIVFIDELDAIGKKRAQGMSAGGGAAEKDNTLNQLLVEMDGMTGSDNDTIVLMAATNNPTSLDEALVRPGRFDRKIQCDLPPTDGRRDIFMVHLKTIKTEKPPKVYAEMLAKLTPGFSGAQIANVVNEAALLAAREQSDLIKSSHFEAAIDRIMSGTRKDNNTIKAETKTILAALEAGKCVVSWLSETQDPVLKASIVPRSHSNVGYTQYQTKERFLQSEEYLKERLGVLLAPKIAQKVLFGRVSTQIDNDKDSTNASDLATKMVTSFGFSKTVGQVNFTQENMYSDATKRQIDIERQNIMNSAIAAAEEILIKNKEKLQEVVNLLIREEVLHASDLEKILGPKRTAEASVDEDV